MNRYPRKPALLILLVAATLGITYVSAWGKIEQLFKKGGGDTSIEALEKRIAEEQKKDEERKRDGTGTASAATWRAYGEALADAKQHAKAASAFRAALAQEPNHRDSKFQCGLQLALAGLADEFYNFQKELVFGEAKLAVDLFERPEARKFLSEERFSALAKEAKNQAMD